MMISQEEYDRLIQIKKVFVEQEELNLAYSWSRKLISKTTKDEFILDYNRGGRIDIIKFSYNKRYKTNIILLRYDIGRHTNPDGNVIKGPHVHLYKEGFNDRWAFPVREIGISPNEQEKREVVLKRIFSYCNIVNYPAIQPILLQ